MWFPGLQRGGGAATRATLPPLSANRRNIPHILANHHKRLHFCYYIPPKFHMFFTSTAMISKRGNFLRPNVIELLDRFNLITRQNVLKLLN